MSFNLYEEGLVDFLCRQYWQQEIGRVLQQQNKQDDK